MHRILVVDDDVYILKVLKFLLDDEGYSVTAVSSAVQALAALQSHEYALILLDIMMPNVNGLDLCRQIRKTSAIPIIFISGKDSVDDIVAGLLSGGDDYVAKPFHPKELLARIVSALRRGGNPVTVESILSTGDFLLDSVDKQLTLRRTGQIVILTPIEARLLRYLLSNPGHVLTRSMLVMHVWGHEYEARSKVLEVNIKRLRDKIEADPAHPQLLLTVRTLGYKYQPSLQRTVVQSSDAN